MGIPSKFTQSSFALVLYVTGVLILYTADSFMLSLFSLLSRMGSVKVPPPLIFVF